MKKILTLLICTVFMATATWAQDDDVYFVPTKKADKKGYGNSAPRSEYVPLPVVPADEENWAAGRGNNGRDVDEYNRRGTTVDTVSTAVADEEVDGYYTSRLVRFHSPTVGIYVSSPYYGLLTDYYWYDPWYSPWAYDFYPYSWYGWGWRPYYYGSYRYGWHHNYWWDCAWGWGWHHHHGPAWGWGHGPGYKPNRNVRPGGRRYDGRYQAGNYRPSRDFGTNNRYSGTSRPSRNYTSGTSRPNRNEATTTRSTPRLATEGSTTTSRPSRNYNNNSGNRSNSSNRSYTPSRSNSSRSSGSSFSAPSRSGGSSGGGRSFGGGGGRSGGGRR